MQAVLVMIRSDGERRSFSIARDMTVIGRREDCDLRIPLGEISRKHCRLVRDGEVLRLEDLGSSNGTYHNGERVQESVLTPGDTIQIGPVVFALQIDGVPADEDLHPVPPQELAAGGASDLDTEVTEGEYSEGEYAAEGELPAEGEYAAEEELPAEGEYATGEELVAEGEYAADVEVADSVPEGEYAALESEPDAQFADAGAGGDYAAEEEPPSEPEGAETAPQEDELFLTEENMLGESDSASSVELPEHHSEGSPDAGAGELHLESTDFTTLDTPETPHAELHLENLDADLDTHRPHG